MIITTTGTAPVVALGLGDDAILLTHPATYDLLGDDSLWDSDDIVAHGAEINAAIAAGTITVTTSDGDVLTSVPDESSSAGGGGVQEINGKSGSVITLDANDVGAAIMTDVTNAIAQHVGANNPHGSEIAGAAAAAIALHLGTTNPHGSDPQGTAAAAVSAHVQASNPHSINPTLIGAEIAGAAVAAINAHLGTLNPHGIVVPPRRESKTIGGRWYARSGRFYVPNNTYGQFFYNFSQNLGNLNPLYYTRGMRVPFGGTIIGADIQFRRSDADNVFTAYLIRCRKTFGTSVVNNVQVGQPLVLSGDSTAAIYDDEWNLDQNDDVENKDYIIPILTGSEASTRYLFFDLTVHFEGNP